jgi:hypothetical protein
LITPYSLVLTVNTGKTFTANAFCQSYAITSPEGSSIVEATFNFKLTGAITPAWA